MMCRGWVWIASPSNAGLPGLLFSATFLLAVVLLTFLHIRRVSDWYFLLRHSQCGVHRLSLGLTGFWLGLRHLFVPADCRTKHLYVVGASGSGKSGLLINLITQDIITGMGVIVIDPHGDLVNDLLPALQTDEDVRRTVLFDLADTEHVIPYNPLARRDGIPAEEQAAKVLLAFKRIWADSWGARMEDILRHSLTLLIEQDLTFCEFDRLLTDPVFRSALVSRSEIVQTRDFFNFRFDPLPAKERAVNIESSLNKVSAFLADPRLRSRLGIVDCPVSVADIIAENKILLVNLAKGRLAGNADLFGALLMADIEMSFLARPRGQRTPVAVYADEFQNIATESFATVLTEARKFGMCLTLAHQSLEQLDDKLIALILGNVQTQVYFRVARSDAERLTKEANNIVAEIKSQIARSARNKTDPPRQREATLSELWELAYHKLTGLPARQAYAMIRGVSREPVLLRTMDNPLWKTRRFEFDGTYLAVNELVQQIAERRAGIDAALGVRKEIKAANSLLPVIEFLPQSGALDHLPDD